MNFKKFLILVLVTLTVGFAAAGCVPSGPCEFTEHMAMQVYRLPDASSEFQGTMVGETHTILAYTANGWIGFDPGFAQAGNIGLAHHRWVYLNGIVTPSCLAGVDQVTLADVQADVAASSGP
jgi:hypothetical protein